MSERPGVLITFEGPEGSGKSTLIRSLVSRLHDLGRTPTVVREPGGTRVGERIRDILLDNDLPELCARTELLLMVASRAQLVHQTVEPALAAGEIVICDRYADASVAYQGGGRSLGADTVDPLNDFAVGASTPDLTLLCLLPPAEGRKRMARREKDRLELEGTAFHDRVYDAYTVMAESGDPRFRVVDASGTPATMLEQSLEHLRNLEHHLLIGL